MGDETAGANLKRLRTVRELTQQELALRIAERTGRDVSIATISKLEKAQMTWSLDWVDEVARALRVTPHELVADAGTPVRLIPVLDETTAADWARAMKAASHWIPAPADTGGPSAFALWAKRESFGQLAGDEGYVAVDPEQRSLVDGKAYLVQGVAGDSSYSRFSAAPPQLVPCSTSPEREPLLIGAEPFVVIGRVTWVASAL